MKLLHASWPRRCLSSGLTGPVNRPLRSDLLNLTVLTAGPCTNQLLMVDDACIILRRFLQAGNRLRRFCQTSALRPFQVMQVEMWMAHLTKCDAPQWLCTLSSTMMTEGDSYADQLLRASGRGSHAIGQLWTAVTGKHLIGQQRSQAKVCPSFHHSVPALKLSSLP